MNASDHLDGLARALTAAGWSTLARYGNVPAVLLVFASGPSVRVSVKAGTGGVPWFVSSNRDPLRPCHDLAGTVVEIEARLGTSSAVADHVRPTRRPVFERLRRIVRTSG